MQNLQEVLKNIMCALEKEETPALSAESFPCFSEEALAGNTHVGSSDLQTIAQSLTKSDIPTFRRALQAAQTQELAWLGFKIVYNENEALKNTDNEVTKKYGDVGSADALPLVFFCNDAKEIVSSREVSPRDIFQMKDVTRGPSMHTEQFDGLTWLSVPLFDKVRVWLLGASDVASELAALATHVGFETVVIDYDDAYINKERFPHSQLIELQNGNFDALSNLQASETDYACVLTRGHMFDPESCVWALSQNMRYIGMMGCAGKNSTVHDLVIEKGATEAGWERIKRPIGLNFGAKTPAELAIAIVAELIDERYKERYSKEARAKHEQSIGRA